MRTITRVLALLALLAGLLATNALTSPAEAAYESTSSSQWVPDGTVRVVTVAGDRVYLGGAFTKLTNESTGEVVNAANVAALNRTTGQPVRNWNVSTDAGVNAIAVSADQTRVILGGAFVTVNGQEHKRLAAVSAATGDLVPAWSARATGVVNDLFVLDSRVYVAGAFNSLNGVSRKGVGLLNEATGTRVLSFQASVNDPAQSLVVDGPRLLVTGKFDQANGVPRAAMASFDLTTGALRSWSPRLVCPDCLNVWDIAADGDRVYAGVGGRGGGRLVALNRKTAAELWRVRGNGDVQAIAVQGSLVYAGGHFGSRFGGVTRRDFAAVNAATGAVDPDFKPVVYDRYPGVRSLDSTPRALYAGGEFTGVGSPGVSSYFATFAQR